MSNFQLVAFVQKNIGKINKEEIILQADNILDIWITTNIMKKLSDLNPFYTTKNVGFSPSATSRFYWKIYFTLFLHLTEKNKFSKLILSITGFQHLRKLYRFFENSVHHSSLRNNWIELIFIINHQIESKYCF